MFEEFIHDEEAWDMFITGRPGTGKTTSLGDMIQYCMDNQIEYTACAYTHKACNILRSKLPPKAEVRTLHSFLRKRPTINTLATKEKHIEKTVKVGASDALTILFIDEFSMVGEEDLMDIRSLQDPDYDGNPGMKVVWIGDMNQLPPVKDMDAVVPREPYWQKLTKIYRQEAGNPLLDTIHELADIIEGIEDPHPLKRHETFVQQDDLLEGYREDDSDKVILVYTNERVQDLNFEIMDRDYPIKNDRLFCNTSHGYYTLADTVPKEAISLVDRLWDDPLGFNSKYKTLEFLISMDICDFMNVVNGDGDTFTFPVIFGTYNYKQYLHQFGKAASEINYQIQREFTQNPAKWAANNPHHKLARQRALAWRKYLTFKDTVLCMDFDKAMTVHKSQGSTFETVYLDVNNLEICKAKNFNLYARLYYVAVSRASKKVITN